MNISLWNKYLRRKKNMLRGYSWCWMCFIDHHRYNVKSYR